MTRSRYLVLGVAVLAVMLFAVPASATHNNNVTVSASSSYAAVCGAAPGDATPTMPVGVTNGLATNQAGAAAFRVPADLTDPNNAGVCDFATDSVWSAATVNHLAGCNATTFTACRGLHFPGLGPPGRPGRFLNYADGFGAVNPASACVFVSSGSPNQGNCRTWAVGYVDPGASTLGGYCGSSRGFSWALSASDQSMTANQVWSMAEWAPNSAGTLLPIQGVTTGPNWGPSSHFSGYTNNGIGQRTINGTRNIFGLASARSYAPGESQPSSPGSCTRAANDGARQFLSQLVTVAIGTP